MEHRFSTLNHIFLMRIAIRKQQEVFTEYSKDHHLNVEFPKELLERIPRESRETLIAVLADDPRPAYQNDPERSYGMPFGEKDIHFRVDGDILRVYNVTDFVKKQQESPADCGK